MQAAPSIKSTAKSTQAASNYKPRVRRLAAGKYLVESESRPGRGHTTTATSCSCIGFSYRHHCKHVALVQALAPSMDAWYAQAAGRASMAASGVIGAVSGLVSKALGLDELAVANADLTRAYRALADAHEQSDEYATLLRRVDHAERVVAAADYAMMRGA